MMNELARYEFNILVALIHMQNSCWLQKMIRKIQFITHMRGAGLSLWEVSTLYPVSEGIIEPVPI